MPVGDDYDPLGTVFSSTLQTGAPPGVTGPQGSDADAAGWLAKKWYDWRRSLPPPSPQDVAMGFTPMGMAGTLERGAGKIAAEAIPKVQRPISNSPFGPGPGLRPKVPGGAPEPPPAPPPAAPSPAAPTRPAMTPAMQAAFESARRTTLARIEAQAEHEALGPRGAPETLPAAPYVASERTDYGILPKKEAQLAQKRNANNPPVEPGPLSTDVAYKPDVPQTSLPRYVPKKGMSPRLQDALTNPEVVYGVRHGIEEGMKQGSQWWYNVEPLRQEFIKELGHNQGTSEFHRFMEYVAATSPRSDIATNIRNASYYHYLEGQGLDPLSLVVGKGANPYPYGHLAQKLHRAGAADVRAGNWDVIQRPKPPSFVENLTGNWKPVTADAHSVKAVAMRSGDPRWLETSVREQRINPQTGKKEYYTVRPRDMVTSGEMSLEQARQRPTYWAGIPRKNEYGGVENFYAGQAEDLGIDPAQAQSAGWVGSGDLTGLGSPPKNFIEILNDVIMRNARARGMDPRDVLKFMIRRQMPLIGAAGVALPTIMNDPGDKGGPSG